MGNGTGSFSTSTTSYSVVAPYDLISDDFNGDGTLDLAIEKKVAVSFFGNVQLLLLLGVGNGSFVPSSTYNISAAASELISGDLNNDGKVDIVNGNSSYPNLMVLLNGAVLGINSTNTLCLGNAINLSAYGASTFTWSTGANTNSITVNPTTTTNYTLTGMSINGCVGSAVKTVSVVICTGINEQNGFKEEG
jgi:hypothetical protein